jgi:hypothetical protein
MRVILKPAGAMIVLGATAVLAAVALTRPQKEQIKEQVELPASDLFKSKKQNAPGLYDSKDKMAPINLTQVGGTDWVVWGTTSDPKQAVRKADSPKAISDFALIMPERKILGVGKRGPARGLTWSNGAPTAKAPIAYGGLYVGEQNGFKFTVPAPVGSKPKKLRVYVGGYQAGGDFSAWITDGSKPKTTHTEIALGQGYYAREYVVEFKASAPGQKMEVVWKMERGGGNVSLLAAALE